MENRENVGHERYSVVVNLTKGYILNMEAKATLRKNVKCCVCSKSYSFCHLKVHLQVDHPKEKRYHQNYHCLCSKVLSHKCDYCTNLLTNKPELSRHKWDKNSKDGLQQVEKTVEILKKYFDRNLQKTWKVYTLLYGTERHPKFPICETCKQFIFTSDDNFVEKLENIFLNEPRQDRSYAGDFYFIVKELLPKRVKIAAEVSDLFSMNKTLMKKISKNVSIAGRPTTVSFWSPFQYNVAAQCLKMKRVMFNSAWSTGKTILMMDCARKLLHRGEKVLFLINDFYNLLQQNPSLLQMKILACFQTIPNCANLLKLETRFFNGLEELLKYISLPENEQYNVFVDELRLDDMSETEYKNLKDLSLNVRHDKHLWLAVAVYNGTDLDKKKLEKFFLMPELLFSLRNSSSVTTFVKSKQELNPHHYDVLDTGKEGIDADANLSEKEMLEFMVNKFKKDMAVIPDFQKVKYIKAWCKSLTSYNSDNGVNERILDSMGAHIRKYKNLNFVSPSNQTKSFLPVLEKVDNFRVGFKKAFEFLKRISNSHYALFICNWTNNFYENCSCYNEEYWKRLMNKKKIRENLKANIFEVYSEEKRKNPTIYLEEEDIDQTTRWINERPKTCDLITDYSMVQGFEHNTVVVFQDQDPEKFDHNSCMRANSYLIVLEIPLEQRYGLCFGKCK